MEGETVTRWKAARAHWLTTVLLTALMTIFMAGCGFLGGNPEVATDATQVAGVAVSATITNFDNENWDLAVKDADRYRGSPVDLTGQIFNVLGTYEGATHYQMFTDPMSRTGNTHLALPPEWPELRERDTIHVVGTLDRMLAIQSRAGSELRIPYVSATFVEIISANGTPAPLVTPAPSPTAPPVTSSPTTEATVEITPTPPPTVTFTPTVTVTEAATESAAETGTAIPSGPYRVEAPSTELFPSVAMEITIDSSAPDGQYLSSKMSSRDWNGNGAIPAGSGTAAVGLDVPKQGRYAVWVRMQYQNIDANSLWLLVDNQRPQLLGNEDSGYGTWKWVGWRDGNRGSRITLDLSAGLHTLTLVSREAGTRFDRLLVTEDLNYRPIDPPVPASPASSSSATPVPTNTASASTETSTVDPANSPAVQPANTPVPATNTPAPAANTPTRGAATARAPATATAPPAPTSKPTVTSTPPPSPTGSASATATRVRPAQSNQPAGGSYTVQPGDTLSEIAERVYGDASQYQRIYAANRDRLSSPDRINPGEQLTIPR